MCEIGLLTAVIAPYNYEKGYIFLKGGNRSIEEEFIPPIVVLGRFRENFDDDGGIEDSVSAIVEELGFAFNEQNIGVGVAVMGRNMEPEVANEGTGAGSSQGSFEQGKEVTGNAVMGEGTSAHGDDGSVVVFAAVFGGFFLGEVFPGAIEAGRGNGVHGDLGGITGQQSRYIRAIWADRRQCPDT